MKKKRRSGVSFGTVFMLLVTALVLASCVLFLSMIAGQDVYERTGEFIRTLAEQGIFVRETQMTPTPTPRAAITFIEDTPAPSAPPTPTPVPQKSMITIAAGGALYAPSLICIRCERGRL